MDGKLSNKFVIAALIVCGVWLGSFIVIYHEFGDWATRGQVGDMFGAVNSLFSGLAFAGLIITLIFQRNDLHLQKAAIEQTNKQLKRQAEEFELQNVMAKEEQFRNTFFDLLRMLQTIVDGLRFDVKELYGSQMSFSGKSVFEELFRDREDRVVADTYMPMPSISQKAMKGDYEYISKSDLFSFLFHYFRFVYRIIKFVDETDVIKSTEEKYQYVAFLRATLSNYEVAAIFYNCLSPNGREKFKPLVEKYALFDNIDVKILRSKNDLSMFEESAYKFTNIS